VCVCVCVCVRARPRCGGPSSVQPVHAWGGDVLAVPAARHPAVAPCS
jgi:hypothetical protein